MFAPTPVTDSFFWFVMRDLKRPNAKQPAYRFLAEQGLEVFTPMTWRLTLRQGKRVREERPFLPDLLFVHCARPLLDPLVELVPTLQYRYIRGAYCEPMTVADADMERFIRAVRSTDSPRYYLPGELTSVHYGRMVRIVGGPLDGCEGRLLKCARFAREASPGGYPQSADGGGGGTAGVYTGVVNKNLAGSACNG